MEVVNVGSGRKSTGPWYRKGRGYYFEQDGQQVPLGKDKEQAWKLWHRRMLEAVPLPPGRYSIPELVDLYLDDCQRRLRKSEIRQPTYSNYKRYLAPWA